MTRIADMAQHQAMLTYMLKNQSDTYRYERQVASEKQAEVYSGLKRAETLVNYENVRSDIEAYQNNIDTLGTQQGIMNDVLGQIETAVNNFQRDLAAFGSKANKTEGEVTALQQMAFNSMLDMQGYLNTEIGGEYLFGGSSDDSPPVNIGFDSLADFQAAFDGQIRTAPTTREANLFDARFDSSKATVAQPSENMVKATGDNTVTFESVATVGGNRAAITATDNDTFPDWLAGMEITISGSTDSGNNKSVRVASVESSGTVLRLAEYDSSGNPIDLNDVTGDANISFTPSFYAQDTALANDYTGANNVTWGTTGAPDSEDYIQFSNAGDETAFNPGDVIQVADDTDSGNNGEYTVSSVDTVNNRIYLAGQPGVNAGNNDIHITRAADRLYAGNDNTFDNVREGGLVELDAGNAGTYRVAAKDPNGAWIQLTNPDGSAASLATADLKNVSVTPAYEFNDNLSPPEAMADQTFSFAATLDDTGGVGADTITAAVGTFNNLSAGSELTLNSANYTDTTVIVDSVSSDGSQITLTTALGGGFGVTAETGVSLTPHFQVTNNNSQPDTITSALTGGFRDNQVGSIITLATGDKNVDGTYRITAKDSTNTTLTVEGVGTKPPGTYTLSQVTFDAAANQLTGDDMAFSNLKAGDRLVLTNAPYPYEGQMVTVASVDDVVGTADGITLEENLSTSVGPTDISLTTDASQYANQPITADPTLVSAGQGVVVVDSLNPAMVGEADSGHDTFTAAPGTFSGLAVGAKITLNAHGGFTTNGGVVNDESLNGKEVTVAGVSEDGATLEVVEDIDLGLGTVGTLNQVTFDSTSNPPRLSGPNNTFAGFNVGDVFMIPGAPDGQPTGPYEVAGVDGVNAAYIELSPGGLSHDTGPVDITVADAAVATGGPMTFTPQFKFEDMGPGKDDVITAGVTGGFQGFSVDDVITVNTGNNATDGTFRITGVDASNTSLTVEPAGSRPGNVAINDWRPGTIVVEAANDIVGGTTWMNGEIDTLKGSAGPTLSAGGPDQFANLPAGATVSVSDTLDNDGTYTIAETDGTTLKLQSVGLVEEESASAVIRLPDGAELEMTEEHRLLFDAENNTISAEKLALGNTPRPVYQDYPDAFADLEAGDSFTISGSAYNDGTYTITSNNGVTLGIQANGVTDEDTDTLTVDPTTDYYQGDTVVRQMRVDSDRTLSMTINAVDPAFEKAFRAMALIAQGQYGTAGGLENNLERVGQARYVVSDALNKPRGDTPPFGTETEGNFEDVSMTLGYYQTVLANVEQTFTTKLSFVDTRISDLENVNMAEAITRLQDSSRALEASYAAIAKVQKLSLLSYL